MEPALQRRRLEVSGQVQGVGFRPCVHRLACALGLTGQVANDGAGATIEVQGPPDRLEAFTRRLAAELPPLAEVRSCRSADLPVREGETGFTIAASSEGELADAQVTPDTAVCPDCLRELADPGDPRYRYPFINCTNCGPRYSIVTAIPYDRANTTMADFALCPLCRKQYEDPADRRFHAQPVACPACGPRVRLTDARGRAVVCEDPIARAADLLARGRIVAVKGLGGFHIACRADDEHAVGRLRRRKHRDAKPFALMVRDLPTARALCQTDESSERLLAGAIRPIVLLPRREPPGLPVARAVAPGLDTLGVMLPYTPLHHLLLARAPAVLVMTSGNISDEPLTKDDADAIAHLGAIADAFLTHDRRIQRALDDSVAQARPPLTPGVKGPPDAPVVLRRGRGYAPRPFALHAPHAPAVLAVGAELKNAVCLARDGRAVLGEHVGDLKDARTYRRFMQVINDLEALFEFAPQVLAADLHPGYLSTEYALRRSRGQLAGRPPLPLVRVQHHHAHAAACLAENERSDAVVAVVCDGTGYGPDGAVWGCEVLRADPREFERLGHLRYFPLPGGDAAAVQTLRPALALLVETFGPAGLAASGAGMDLARRMTDDPRRVAALVEQTAAGANCTPTSSLGRLFDAVSAMCGLARENRYEGEAPMLLEAAAGPIGADDVGEAYPFALTDGEPFAIDFRPMVEALVADLSRGAEVAAVAARFHNTAADFLAAAAVLARERTGLNTVALSGGCFANRRLSGRLEEQLRRDGFEVLIHRQVPCNDGGVALGQALVAAWRSADAPAHRGAAPAARGRGRSR